MEDNGGCRRGEEPGLKPRSWESEGVGEVGLYGVLSSHSLQAGVNEALPGVRWPWVG